MERKKEEEEEELEIKVISGKHLWAFNFFQKLCIYAVGSLSTSPESTLELSKAQIQEQRTPTDLNGDSHPEWNHRMSFHLPSSSVSVSDLFLHFDLRHHAGLLFPDRTIGDVRIPLSDLLDSPSSSRFVDYQVRSPDGKPNGVLHLSYKLNRSQPQPQPQPPAVYQISGYLRISDQPPDLLYPAVDLEDTTSASASASAAPVPEEQGYPEVSQAYPPPQYPIPPPQYPMWPPPPPPPYWAPPGFMHRPPPPPPPGYFHHHPWSYQPPTGSQRNTGR